MSKLKSKINSLRFFINLLPKSTKLYLVFCFFLVLFQASFQVLSVYLMSPLIKYITNIQGSEEKVTLFSNYISTTNSVILFALAFLSSFALSYFVFKSINKLVTKAGYQLATRTFNSLCTKNYQFYKSNNPSELSSAITIQLSQLIGAFFQPFLMSSASILISTFLVTFLLIYSPVVLLAIVLATLIIAPIYYWNMKLAPKAYSYKVKERSEDIISIINSLISSPHAIFFTRITNYLKSTFRKKYLQLRSLQSDIEFSRSFTKYILDLLLSISLLFIFLFTLVGNFNLNISRIAISLIVLQKLIPHLQQIFTSFLLIRSSTAAFKIIISINKDNDLREFIKYSEPTSIQLSNIKSNLIDSSFENPISIKLSSGDRLIIRGPSGSGKSSLLDIISGLVKPASGKVKTLNNSNFLGYKSTAFVPQRYFGIPGSISFNISLKKELNKTEMNLLKKIHYTTLLNKDFTFDELFNIEINEDLSNLSGGQMQRISLARALFKNPYYLLMDEPTSALPKKQSLEIMKNISNFLKNSIIIFVSHKDYESQIANKFIDLK